MEMHNSISEYLCSNHGIPTEQHIKRSLIDIFQVMFNLSLTSACVPLNKRTDFIPAYVTLTHDNATACVHLHISRDAAVLIAQRAGLDVTDLSTGIIQDVACEIVNIVGNSLRSFISESTGICFEMGATTAGEYDATSTSSVLMDMDFQVNPQASVKLSLMCSDGHC